MTRCGRRSWEGEHGRCSSARQQGGEGLGEAEAGQWAGHGSKYLGQARYPDVYPPAGREATKGQGEQGLCCCTATYLGTFPGGSDLGGLQRINDDGV